MLATIDQGSARCAALGHDRHPPVRRTVIELINDPGEMLKATASRLGRDQRSLDLAHLEEALVDERSETLASPVLRLGFEGERAPAQVIGVNEPGDLRDATQTDRIAPRVLGIRGSVVCTH
jgi:hypothetical protein